MQGRIRVGAIHQRGLRLPSFIGGDAVAQHAAREGFIT